MDTTATTISLNSTISGYEYIGAYYLENETQTPAAGSKVIDRILKKVDDAWQYTDISTSTNDFVGDGSHIYVTYKEKSGGTTPTPIDADDIPTPTTVKNVTDNRDGTYDVQLDIIGKQINKEEESVILI